MSDKQTRDVSLDFVRCVMNYLVVVLHAWAGYQYVARDTIEFATWTFICSHVCWLALPAFFLISGYLLFQRFSLAVWPTKMMRRLKRLLVPYLVWNLLFVLFYLVMSSVSPRLSARVDRFGLETFWGACEKVLSLTTPPIDGPLWFLRALLLFAIFSPLLWFVLKFWKGYVALVASLVLVVTAPKIMASEVLQAYPPYALFCFLLGGVVAINGKDLVALFRHWWWIVLGLVNCILCFIILRCNIFPHTETMSLIARLAPVLEAPCLIALVGYLPTARWVKSNVFRFARDMGFFAYASHFLFCSMWLHACAPAVASLQTGKFTVLILIFLIPGVSTIAVAYWFGRRYAPTAIKVFDGSL